MILVQLMILMNFAVADCKLFAVEKHAIDSRAKFGGEIEVLSRSLNTALRTSSDILILIDRLTLGLASALVIGKGVSFENIRPSKWSEARFDATLLYHQELSTVPVRGAKVSFKTEAGQVEKVTGTKGEFFANFEKLVPYNRLRIFPYVIFEIGKKKVRTIKIPLEIEVKSKICSAKTKIYHLPTSPLILFLTGS